MSQNKSKLNTDLAKSAKLKKEEDEIEIVEENDQSDDYMYTMGEIIIEDGDDEGEDQKILQTAQSNSEDDDEESSNNQAIDFGESEDIFGADEFLDQAGYDPEEDDQYY